MNIFELLFCNKKMSPQITFQYTNDILAHPDVVVWRNNKDVTTDFMNEFYKTQNDEDNIDDYLVEIFCLDEDEYSSEDFKTYLFEYFGDFLKDINGIIPKSIDYEIYEAIGEILFVLSPEEDEYWDVYTKLKVYSILHGLNDYPEYDIVPEWF